MPKDVEKLKRGYEEKLDELHMELVKMQYWIKESGQKVVVLFEGRDAAGKGGAIKRITEPLNPRGCRVVALGTPSDTRDEPSGTSSATSPTCPPPARSCCSTGAGTTGPASST